MSRYTTFTQNIVEYSKSITQNKFGVLDSFYVGDDLKNIIDTSVEASPLIVAALEQVKGFERANDLKNKDSYGAYYKSYGLAADSRRDYYDFLAKRVAKVVK